MKRKDAIRKARENFCNGSGAVGVWRNPNGDYSVGYIPLHCPPDFVGFVTGTPSGFDFVTVKLQPVCTGREKA